MDCLKDKSLRKNKQEIGLWFLKKKKTVENASQMYVANVWVYWSQKCWSQGCHKSILQLYQLANILFPLSMARWLNCDTFLNGCDCRNQIQKYLTNCHKITQKRLPWKVLGFSTFPEVKMRKEREQGGARECFVERKSFIIFSFSKICFFLGIRCPNYIVGRRCFIQFQRSPKTWLFLFILFGSFSSGDGELTQSDGFTPWTTNSFFSLLEKLFSIKHDYYQTTKYVKKYPLLFPMICYFLCAQLLSHIDPRWTNSVFVIRPDSLILFPTFVNFQVERIKAKFNPSCSPNVGEWEMLEESFWDQTLGVFW